MPNPSTRFHLWVYRARPDVRCILHTHPPHVSALSMLGEELAVAHMDTTMFYEDCAYLPDWPGVPFGDEEGEIIAGALGQKHAILLGHHGQLVACATIEEAAVLAIFIERAAKMQLRARAVGPIRPIRPELAREARQYRLKSKAIEATFNYFARQILRDQGDGAIR
jgi:L-fuculose-phosphate aldolase